MITERGVRNKRAKYIQETVRNSTRTDEAVSRLSKELFLSERTIYNDLAKSVY